MFFFAYLLASFCPIRLAVEGLARGYGHEGSLQHLHVELVSYPLLLPLSQGMPAYRPIICIHVFFLPVVSDALVMLWLMLY